MIALNPGYVWLHRPEFVELDYGRGWRCRATIMLPDGQARHFTADLFAKEAIAALPRHLRAWLVQWRAIPDGRKVRFNAEVAARLVRPAVLWWSVRYNPDDFATVHDEVPDRPQRSEYVGDAIRYATACIAPPAPGSVVQTAPSPDHWTQPPNLAIPWCPLCAPERDLTREILDVRYCHDHQPDLGGVDDGKVTAR